MMAALGQSLRSVGHRALLALLGVLCVAALAAVLDVDMRRALQQRLNLPWLEGTWIERDARAAEWGAGYFPNPVLTDQYGRRWRFYDDLIKGKAVAVNTFFTVCADICPLGTAKMRELQRLLGDRMGRDVFFYSISVDPLRDSPEALKQYADRYQIGPGWLLLTGRDEDVRLISRKLGLGRLQQTDARESHSATLTIGDEPSGRWMKNAATDNPQYLAAHMATFLGWPADLPQVTQAEARPLKISSGEFLFRNACAACHQIGGKGDGAIGPDLMHIGQRRSADWLRRFVQAPDAMIKAGDPTAVALVAEYKGVLMPNLGLTPDEVELVLAYIVERSSHIDAQSAGSRRAATAR